MQRPSGALPGFAVAILAMLAAFVVLVAGTVQGQQVAAVVATVMTFLAIVWTAYETAALRAETVRQTEVEQRPVLVIESSIDREIHMKNVGRGAAPNIRVPKENAASGDFLPWRFNIHIRSEYRLPS